MEYRLDSAPTSLWLDVGRPDHLRPFLGFVSDELAEFGRRHRQRYAAEVGKRRVDLALIVREQDFNLRAEDEAGGLRARDDRSRRISTLDIDQSRKALAGGQQFVQQFDPFRRYVEVHRADAGNVAARMIEALDEADLHRIGAERKDDGYLAGRRLGRARRRWRAERDDDRHPTLDQIGGQSRQPV